MQDKLRSKNSLHCLLMGGGHHMNLGFLLSVQLTSLNGHLYSEFGSKQVVEILKQLGNDKAAQFPKTLVAVRARAQCLLARLD